MTTVDVYVRAERGAHDVLAFHNGLFGPATTLQSAILSAAHARRDGVTWVGSNDYRVPGAVLRGMLADVRLDEGSSYQNPTAEKLRNFIEGELQDSCMYQVTCIEF